MAHAQHCISKAALHNEHNVDDLFSDQCLSSSFLRTNPKYVLVFLSTVLRHTLTTGSAAHPETLGTKLRRQSYALDKKKWRSGAELQCAPPYFDYYL